MEEITILAVTRLSTGVCISGVTKNGDWIRPTKPNYSDSWRQLEYDDCKDSKGNWIVKKGNIVIMDLQEHIPSGAHSEDWRVGSCKPELVEKLDKDEYMNVCKELSEESLESIEKKDANRSLIMVLPEQIRSFSFTIERNWEGKRKYIPRCSFRLDGDCKNDMGISDAEWRGYGKQLIDENGGDIHSIQATEVFNNLDVENCWFTIGRNLMHSKPYLLVVGIHLFPVQEFEMDFERV